MCKKFFKLLCLTLCICFTLTNISYGHNISGGCKNHVGGTRYYYIDKTVKGQYYKAYKYAVNQYSKLSYIDLRETTNMNKATLILTVSGNTKGTYKRAWVGKNKINISGDYNEGTGGVHNDHDGRCYIVINRYSAEKYAKKVNLNNVTMHEIGHAYGLKHVSSKKSIMYHETSSITKLQPMDISNLSKMYEPSISRVSTVATKTTRTTKNIKISGIVSATHKGSTIQVYDARTSKRIASSNINYGKSTFQVNINNLKIGTRIRITITSKEKVKGNSITKFV